MIAVVYACEMLIGYDGTILSNLQALPGTFGWKASSAIRSNLLFAAWQADLNYPSASRIGLLNAMSYIAGIISGPVASWALEKYGRKPALQHFSITMLIGTILGCVAGKVQGNGGFGLFCASKFIIGSGELHGVNFACSALTFPLARHGYRSHDGPNHATRDCSPSLSYYHRCSLCTSPSTLHEPTSVGAPFGVLLRVPRSQLTSIQLAGSKLGSWSHPRRLHLPW